MFPHQSSEGDREHTPWCIAAERTNESCEGGHQSGKKHLEVKIQLLKFAVIHVYEVNCLRTAHSWNPTSVNKQLIEN